MKSWFFSLLLWIPNCTGSLSQSPPPEAMPPAPLDSIPVSVTPDTLPPAAERLRIDYDTLQWMEVLTLDPSIQVEMKYATEDNFVKARMYDCGRCFLRPAVARAVASAHRQLQAKGYGLKMLDCYRPRPIQWKLWEKVPDPRYVSDPRKGSMHNRGAAVDLTLVDSLGRELDMGTPFDFFGPEAYPAYTALSDSILQRRRLLTATMEANGFRGIRTEWWHFAFRQGGFELSDWLWKCD